MVPACRALSHCPGGALQCLGVPCSAWGTLRIAKYPEAAKCSSKHFSQMFDADTSCMLRFPAQTAIMEILGYKLIRQTF